MRKIPYLRHDHIVVHALWTDDPDNSFQFWPLEFAKDASALFKNWIAKIFLPKHVHNFFLNTVKLL